MAKEIDGVRYNKKQVQYTKKLANKIHALYLEGDSILKISKMSGMPSAETMYRWRKLHSWFGKLMDDAKAQRAEVFEDKAIAAAESATDKDDTPAERLRFDAFRWGAEVNDPASYGKKVTHSGDSSKPIVFQIITGFPDPNEHQRPPLLDEGGLIIKK